MFNLFAEAPVSPTEGWVALALLVLLVFPVVYGIRLLDKRLKNVNFFKRVLLVTLGYVAVLTLFMILGVTVLSIMRNK